MKNYLKVIKAFINALMTIILIFGIAFIFLFLKLIEANNQNLIIQLNFIVKTNKKTATITTVVNKNKYFISFWNLKFLFDNFICFLCLLRLLVII